MIAPDGSLVWVETTVNGSIHRAKPDVTSMSGMALYTPGTTDYSPVAMAVDSEGFSWIERNTKLPMAGRVQRAKWADNQPVVLANSENIPYGLSVPGDGYVYWTTSGDGYVKRVPRGGGMLSTTITVSMMNTDIRGVAIANGIAYFANNAASQLQQTEVTAVMKSPTKAADSMKPEAVLATMDGTLYWTETGNPGGIRRYSPSIGMAKDMATGQVNAFGLAADATHLYWSERGTGAMDGTVKRIKLDGSETKPLLIARGLDSPSSVAVDGQYVYWTTNVAIGQVLKTSK